MFIRISLVVSVIFAVLSYPQMASAIGINFQEGVSPNASYGMDAVRIRSTSTGIDGNTTALFAGRVTNPGDYGRSLLAFDISYIEPGSTITGVTLTLTKRNDDSGVSEDHNITVHELVGTFIGHGPNSPDWAHRDVGAATPWDTPGGDFNATVLTSLVANPVTTDDGDKFVFPSTPNFLAAVQNAYSGSGKISMLVMSADSEADDDRGLFQFWSDDQTDTDDRPLLTIDVKTPLSLLVDRTSGNLSLHLDGAANDIENVIAYSITSDIGALNPGTWTSIAENYDADSGGSVDATNTWEELTHSDVRTDLSEAALSAITGLTITAGQTIDLGNAWIKNPTEDLKVELLIDDGSPTGLIKEYDVEFVPGSGSFDGYEFGDLDFDGDIDEDDFFNEFVPSYLTDTSTFSPAEQYQAGDFNENGKTDFFDFIKFNQAYLAANPSASALSFSAVPEPGSLILFALGGVAMLFQRRMRFAGSFLPGKLGFVLALFVVSALLTSDAVAVKITNLTTGELLFYDDFEISPNGVSSMPFPDDANGSDYDPVVPDGFPGYWQIANSSPGAPVFEDEDPFYNTQVTNSLISPDPLPIQGSNYLRVDRWSDGSPASATFDQNQSTQGDVIRIDLMFATPSEYGPSNGAGIVYRDALGYPIISMGFDDDGTIDNRDGNGAGSTISSDVPGLTHTVGEWGRLIIDYEIGASTYSMTYNGVTATDLPLRYDANVTQPEMRPLSEIDVLSIQIQAGGRSEGANPPATAYADAVPELELHVNKTTGKVLIANKSLSTVVTDGYSIESDLSALNPGGWDSLDDQEFDGTDTWTQLGDVSTELSEGSLGHGSTLAAEGFTDLGIAYNTGNGAEDLTFLTHMFGGNYVWDGAVQYFESGDMNADGEVNATDVPYFIQALTNRAAYLANGFGLDADFIGDFDGNGLLDFGDINQFSAAVASASASSTAVPEPASALLLTVTACCFASTNRRRCRATRNQL